MRHESRGAAVERRAKGTLLPQGFGGHGGLSSLGDEGTSVPEPARSAGASEPVRSAGGERSEPGEGGL